MKITIGTLNRKCKSLGLCTAILLLVHTSCETIKKLDSGADPFVRSVQVELPNQEQNAIKTSWPSIGCWFWTAEEFKPEGYKLFIDLYEKYSPFKLITASIRYPGELTDPEVHSRIKAASEYAREKGIGIVMDLDVRLAREAFRERYPNELQEILLLREFPIQDTGTTNLIVKSPSFSDHYTYGRSQYYPIKSRLLRIYSYEKENNLIKAGSLTDITTRSRSAGGKDQLELSVNGETADRGRTACALVAVTIHTPDVFAPHLLSYQREILKQYADASLSGACIDEWGFPGRVDPLTNELWYSTFMAEEYEKRRPGHDLTRDMLLMSFGEQGKETERAVAVNHYMEMNFQRNAQIETDYYNGIKEIFGESAMSATHPTWFPYPNSSEIFKNGLSLWDSKRDLAQTDEGTPFSIRTALAKKWQSPLWYNMYYAKSLEAYHKDIWISALGGGRLNYHPLWPHPMDKLTTSLLEDHLLMKAESRIQLLNYISSAAIDCPVAVIFGHPSALNWTNEKCFADVGLNITNALWKDGFYADLIPSSEIINGSLKINAKGKIQYGSQQYEAAVFYHPEYDRKEVADFFVKAAQKDKISLYRVGDWTTNFEGLPFDGNAALPDAMKSFDGAACSQSIITLLKAKGIQPQTQSEMREIAGFPASMMPKPAGQSRLIDGTVILASGENDVMGDPIKKSIQVDGRNVNFDAIGVAAVRLDKSGKLEALACGGLKSFSVGTFKINLPERMDIALFKENDKWRGIVHGYKGEMPKALIRITKNWIHVRTPAPYSSNENTSSLPAKN